MNDEHFILYTKLQTFYVDTHDLLYSKNYFKASEQFSTIHHVITEYMLKHEMNKILNEMFSHLKSKCQQNIVEVNNYLYHKEEIEVEKDDVIVDIENSIEDLEGDDIVIEPPSFFDLFLRFINCCPNLDYYLFKKLVNKEKND